MTQLEMWLELKYTTSVAVAPCPHIHVRLRIVCTHNHKMIECLTKRWCKSWLTTGPPHLGKHHVTWPHHAVRTAYRISSEALMTCWYLVKRHAWLSWTRRARLRAAEMIQGRWLSNDITSAGVQCSLWNRTLRPSRWVKETEEDPGQWKYGCFS